MTPIETGVPFLLAVEDSGTPGTYNTLGAQRGGGFERTAQAVDTTNKDDAGHAKRLVTKRDYTFTVNGLLVLEDQAYLDVEAAWESNSPVSVQWTMGTSGDVYRGDVVVTSLAIDMPYDDVVTLDATFEAADVYTKNPV